MRYEQNWLIRRGGEYFEDCDCVGSVIVKWCILCLSAGLAIGGPPSCLAIIMPGYFSELQVTIIYFIFFGAAVLSVLPFFVIITIFVLSPVANFLSFIIRKRR